MHQTEARVSDAVIMEIPVFEWTFYLQHPFATAFASYDAIR